MEWMDKWMSEKKRNEVREIERERKQIPFENAAGR